MVPAFIVSTLRAGGIFNKQPRIKNPRLFLLL